MRLLLLLGLSTSPCVVGLDFFNPLFEKLDHFEIDRQYSGFKLSALSEESQLDILFLGFFLSESHFFRKQIHSGANMLRAVESRCSTHLESKFQAFKNQRLRKSASLLCALVYSESLQMKHPISRSGRVSSVRECLGVSLGTKAQTPDDEKERLYVEGRVFYRLPPLQGEDLGRSLLSLHFLRGLQPEATSIDFWIAHAHFTHGQRELGLSSLKKALERSDKRAKYYEGEVRLTHLGEENYGLITAAGWLPVAGFFARLGVYDDRLFDKNAQGEISALGSSAGALSAEGKTKFPLGIDPFFLDAKVSYGGGVEAYYGSGNESQTSDRLDLKVVRSEWYVGLIQPFLKHFYLALGWKGGTYSFMGSNDSILPAGGEQSQHTGPASEFGYDTRDFSFPLSGEWIRLGGYFPTKGLGSRESFEEFYFEAQKFFSLERTRRVALELGVSTLAGEAPPFAELRKLGGSFSFFPIRTGRFQDKSLCQFGGEYSTKLVGPLRVSFFLMLGSVGSSLSQILSSSLHLGGGGGLELLLSHSRKEGVRADLSLLGSEFNLQVVGGRNF